MRKVTIYLPDALNAALDREAAETRRTKSEIIRRGLEHVLARQEPPAPHTGIFDSGDGTLSERVDDTLSGFGEP